MTQRLPDPPPGASIVEIVACGSVPHRLQLVKALSERQLQRAERNWRARARSSQQPPDGWDWRTWLILGGRGFGKTRAGAEWVRRRPIRARGSRWSARPWRRRAR
jgi:hypothetical protein